MTRDLDPPQKLLKTIIDLRAERQLRQLQGVLTVPSLRLDGSVLDKQGYDTASRLFLHVQGMTANQIPNEPTIDQCAEALKTLMAPFTDFPFAGPVDRAVLLAALLTAVVRPSLPTAPAFGFDAPVQGTGKTLLAKCVSMLACGVEPSVWPPTNRREDDEMRKRITSALSAGGKAIIIDNIVSEFDSVSLAAALTSSVYTDRLLGKSQTLEVPNKALFFLTGNNLTLSGDMPRRTFVCRLVPQQERPDTRRFSLDPLSYVREHRVSMAAAAVCLMRGALVHQGDVSSESTASFEDWDRLVRQPVIWAADVLRCVDLADPAICIDKSYEADPQLVVLRNFYKAWFRRYGSALKTSSALCEELGDSDKCAVEFAEALCALNASAASSAKALGATLSKRKDRAACGLRLESLYDRHEKIHRWRVCEIVEPVGGGS